jgi:hypothetical protein
MELFIHSTLVKTQRLKLGNNAIVRTIIFIAMLALNKNPEH